MDNRGGNNQMAETQEIDTQSTMIQSQYYTCDNYIDIWGTLKHTGGEIIILKASITHFGREEVRSAGVANYVFDEKKIRKSVYDRVSKNHFTIERKLHIDPSEPNYEPAILTCQGRNGLTVGTDKLSQGDKRILKDGDWIYLPMNYKIFHFTYTKSEEGHIDRSCKLHEKFFIGQTVGRGGCGIVRKITTLLPPRKDMNGQFVFENYAVKCLQKPEDNLSQSKEAILKTLKNEIAIMRQINYVHMLSLFEVYESPNHVYLVFPLMNGGDLLSKIINSPKKHFTEADAKYYFNQLVLGLKYLHTKGITHRDIKPDNVLLTDRGENPLLKISDFGLSKMNDVMVTQCGTEIYVAPEVMKKRTNYTNAVDVWSAGVLLFAMICGKMPFSNNQQGTCRDNILACRYEFKPSHIWDELPTAKNIVSFMLQLNPRNRLSAGQLVAHKWLCDKEVRNRLERAYVESNSCDVFYCENNDLTEDLELTLVNVSISEDTREVIHPSKRQKLY